MCVNMCGFVCLLVCKTLQKQVICHLSHQYQSIPFEIISDTLPLQEIVYTIKQTRASSYLLLTAYLSRITVWL